MEDPGPKHQGTLEKQGKMKTWTWKKYWFVLKGSELTYVKNQDRATTQGRIDLSQAQSVRAVNVNHGHPFEVVTRSRTHYLSAAKADDRDKWVKVLQEAMAWRSRINSRLSTRSSFTNRDSCDSIPDDDDVFMSPTGSPLRSSGYSSKTSSQAYDDPQPASRDSDIPPLYTTPSPDTSHTSNSAAEHFTRNSGKSVASADNLVLYEEVDNSALSLSEENSTVSSVRGSMQSTSSGNYDEVRDLIANLAIARIVEGYSSVPRNEGTKMTTEVDSGQEEEENEYDEVFDPLTTDNQQSSGKRTSKNRMSNSRVSNLDTDKSDTQASDNQEAEKQTSQSSVSSSSERTDSGSSASRISKDIRKSESPVLSRSSTSSTQSSDAQSPEMRKSTVVMRRSSGSISSVPGSPESPRTKPGVPSKPPIANKPLISPKPKTPGLTPPMPGSLGRPGLFSPGPGSPREVGSPTSVPNSPRNPTAPVIRKIKPPITKRPVTTGKPLTPDKPVLPNRYSSDPISPKGSPSKDKRIPPDVTAYFKFPPIESLPHPRQELTWRSPVDQIREFLGNNRGPNECFSIKPSDRPGEGTAQLKLFLAAHSD